MTVRGFPTSTWPGLLDELNRLAFPYRWVTRFLFLDKADAERELIRLRRQWFAKRKNIVALLRESMFQQESPLVDSDADNKAADADAALQELGSDAVAYGYVTATVVVMDSIAAAADDKRKAIERVIQGRGFVTIAETFNAVEAVAVVDPGPCVRQRAAALDLDPEPRPSDAAVGGMGGSRAECPLERAAPHGDENRGVNALSAGDPCRRRRPHPDRGTDGGREVGTAHDACAAISALCRGACLHLR